MIGAGTEGAEADMLELSENICVRKEFVGIEKTPIIIVDNMFKYIDKICESVRVNAKFNVQNGNIYPGLQAGMFRDFGETVLSYAKIAITGEYDGVSKLQCKPYAAFFSMVSSPGAALSFKQRIPHCDHNSPSSFAVMLYLAEGDFGGTAFFKHNKTQFETVDELRKACYATELESLEVNSASEFKGYHSLESPHFTAIGSVPYRQNRLLIYPGNLLHSGLIKDERDVFTSPQQGRLAANLFLRYE